MVILSAVYACSRTPSAAIVDSQSLRAAHIAGADHAGARPCRLRNARPPARIERSWDGPRFARPSAGPTGDDVVLTRDVACSRAAALDEHNLPTARSVTLGSAADAEDVLAGGLVTMGGRRSRHRAGPARVP